MPYEKILYRCCDSFYNILFLMYAGETTIMEGIVASLAAGWFFGLLAEMFVAIISVVRETFNS